MSFVKRWFEEQTVVQQERIAECLETVARYEEALDRLTRNDANSAAIAGLEARVKALEDKGGKK